MVVPRKLLHYTCWAPFRANPCNYVRYATIFQEAEKYFGARACLDPAWGNSLESIAWSGFWLILPGRFQAGVTGKNARIHKKSGETGYLPLAFFPFMGDNGDAVMNSQANNDLIVFGPVPP